MAASLSSFADRVRAWHTRHGRKDLPWQRCTTPYRVWISEIMLQQTQVATVIPYFERFMAHFPDVHALAEAPLDEVLHHWSGLGYYARARNLHRAAQLICERHDRRFPEDFDDVLGLPGIGRSTAGAILALACHQKHPILDGNVKRVLARHRLIEGWLGTAKVERTLWLQAEALLPDCGVAAYTQGLMDLGATLCTPRQPACALCPVHTDCLAFAQGQQEQFPGAKPRKPAVQRDTTMAMVCHLDGEILLERRPPSGIWGGLWSFPEIDNVQAAPQWCRHSLGVTPLEVTPWPAFLHTFSHFKLRITPVQLVVGTSPHRVMEGDRFVWYNMARSQRGLAAPVTRLIQQIQHSALGNDS